MCHIDRCSLTMFVSIFFQQVVLARHLYISKRKHQPIKVKNKKTKYYGKDYWY